MPASLYRLAGKPHFAEVSTDDQATQEIVEAPVEQAPIEIKELVTEVVESVPVQTDTTPAPEPIDANVVETAPVVSWDPTWTKAQLTEAAVSMGLTVSPTSTKADIIALLTAASKS